MTVEPLAEQVVDEQLAARLVGGQFPELAGLDVAFLAAGWDNTVHVVGGTWVFRFPRRAVALGCQERELRVLPLVAPRVSLPVPLPELVGHPTAEYPWPFWGGRVVPGRELADAPYVDRVAAAADAGRFLRLLHAVPAPADLPIDPMRRGDPAARLARTTATLTVLRATGRWDEPPAVQDLVDQAGALGPSDDPPVLVHGDLHLRHLLVGDDGRASGVIDWGDACRADPAVDLSLLYAACDGPARRVALAEYGPVPADRELRARSLAVGLCATLAVGAAEAGRTALLAEVLAGLARACAE